MLIHWSLFRKTWLLFLTLGILLAHGPVQAKKFTLQQFSMAWRSEEIAPDEQDSRQQNLNKMVSDYLRDRWKIAEARYFLSPNEPTWIAVYKSVYGDLRAKGYTKEIDIEWQRIGIDTINIYKHGRIRRQLFAIAMFPDPIDGQWIFGYFLLK